ncbi:uncharacterized protein MAM_03466 [Metarhizium album ARSEF 1941]|uniref:Uncharacterized protein n=1 Tax=Metarhizium album (strain ARSEF 1941) TaxID=1081103 RepID=A0A0B2WZJ1_METAS|nr:uncharacterized protein MAM_03466 [Metarhizium album ARSEF 1941]KHN99004.1 hypothetical protein MAM_03466 [Metarhizium album ARSEF 1941]
MPVKKGATAPPRLPQALMVPMPLSACLHGMGAHKDRRTRVHGPGEEADDGNRHGFRHDVGDEEALLADALSWSGEEEASHGDALSSGGARSRWCAGRCNGMSM